MSAIGTTPTGREYLAMLLATLPVAACQGETAAVGGARAAADLALARLRWTREAAAIDAEDIVTQAEEALSLG